MSVQETTELAVSKCEIASLRPGMGEGERCSSDHGSDECAKTSWFLMSQTVRSRGRACGT